MSTSSDEFFYLDENGKKQDRALHAELLGPSLDGVVHVSGVEAAKKAGLTDKEMAAIGLIKEV